MTPIYQGSLSAINLLVVLVSCNARQSGSPLAFIPIRDFQHDDDDCMAAIDEL